MYKLIYNDNDYLELINEQNPKNMPVGYPCAISLENRYEFIYIPANVRDFDSFLAGLNTRIGRVDKR